MDMLAGTEFALAWVMAVFGQRQQYVAIWLEA